LKQPLQKTGLTLPQFPNDVEDEYIGLDGLHKPASLPPGPKAVNLHMLRFRQIQSEMQSLLRQTTPPGHNSVDLMDWRVTMHQRIQRWYDEIPRLSAPADYERKIIENFDLTYYRALLYLYQPHSRLMGNDEDAYLVVPDAVDHIVALYRKFFDEKRLTIYWQAIENLSAAGLALLHSYTRSLLVRERVPRRLLQTRIQMCSSLLWAMVEHFPSFRSKRDDFDETAGRILSTISVDTPDAYWPESAAAERQNAVFPDASRHTLGMGDSRNGISDVSDRRLPVEGIQVLQRSNRDDSESDALHVDGSLSTDGGGQLYADFESAAFDWSALETFDDDTFASWL
jgi:hypothetical protein